MLGSCRYVTEIEQQNLQEKLELSIKSCTIGSLFSRTSELFTTGERYIADRIAGSA